MSISPSPRAPQRSRHCANPTCSALGAWPARYAGSSYQVISFDSDWRFGTQHSEHIEAQLTARGADVRRHEVHSPWGHDSFLMDVPEYHRLVREFVGDRELA
jgi:hypothetical protein